MIAWFVALVVWIAAGARIGRVLARHPTSLRNAMVVSVVSAAVASTVVIPQVSSVVAEIAPGSDLPRTVALLSWLFCSAGGAVGAIAVWPSVSRRWMRPMALLTYGAAVVVGVAACLDLVIPAFVFMTVTLATVVGTGLMHVAWAPLGRGIALIVGGAALLWISVVVALAGELSGNHDQRLHSAAVYAGAALLISIGSVWVLAEMWVRARMDLRRLRPMHDTLIERFPEVIDGVGGAGTTVLRASDSVAQVMDAMYVQAGAGLFATREDPPTSSRDHARVVAKWVRDPEGSAVIDTRWIAPPEGCSPRRWALQIADEYNTGGRKTVARTA